MVHHLTSPRSTLVLTLLAVGVSALAYATPQPTSLPSSLPSSLTSSLTPEVARSEAKALLAELKPAFKATLMGAMKAHGPLGAIDACATEAPNVPSTLKHLKEAEERGFSLKAGRASHKLRNAKLNTSPAWLTQALQSASQSTQARPVAPSLTPIKRATGELEGYGYAEPIYTLPPCLTCHGETLAPALAEKLKERYPHDQATGFKLGDFRGFFLC